MFNKIFEVNRLDDMKLHVTFVNGVVKIYDIKQLLDKYNQFQMLNVDGLFECVKVDVGGYGVSWNGELDLSCDELWDNGVLVFKMEKQEV